MPSEERSVRTGRRSTSRSTIMPAGPTSAESPSRSTRLFRYTAGEGGRIASAGGSRTAARTARSAPASAAPPAIRVAAATSGSVSPSRTAGKRNTLAYRSSMSRPSAQPPARPSAVPGSSTTATRPAKWARRAPLP